LSLSPTPPHLLLFVITPRPPRSPLFPYTTLFRSHLAQHAAVEDEVHAGPRDDAVAAARLQRVPVAHPEVELAVLRRAAATASSRSEEHTSELQSRFDLVCRLLLEKKNNLFDAPHL